MLYMPMWYMAYYGFLWQLYYRMASNYCYGRFY